MALGTSDRKDRRSNKLKAERLYMLETRIFVGLNDSTTMEQKFDTEKYVSILRGVCKSYGVPFSFSLAEGGYFHDDGTYTQENSLIITLIDVDRRLIEEMAKDLCVFFHQESVMITESDVTTYYIREGI